MSLCGCCCDEEQMYSSANEGGNLPLTIMSYYSDTIDRSNKIAVNGVDLVNRHELSSYQERELQRYIDENAHILSWKDREVPEPPPRKIYHTSNYSTISRDLSRGPSSALGYSSIDRLAKKKPAYSEYTQDQDTVRVITPSIEHANYVTDFPGIENSENDNAFLLQFGGRFPAGTTSRPASAASNYAPSQQYTSRTYSITPNPTTLRTTYSREPTYDSVAREHTPMSHYAARASNLDPYAISDGTQSLHRDFRSRPNLPAHPYSSLRRKGVSWLDQERARSHSPQQNRPTPPVRHSPDICPHYW